jgi:cullin-4
VRSIFENPQLMDTLRSSVVTLITEERDVRLVQPTNLRISVSPRKRMVASKTADIPALVSHLYTHQQYSVFEEYYRTTTLQYYEEESKKLATELEGDPKGFFSHVQHRIDEEAERSKKLLPVGSWGIIRDATLRSLLRGRMQWIAEKSQYYSLCTVFLLTTHSFGSIS